MPLAPSHLRALARQYPSAESAIAGLGSLRARLTLPKGTIHVVSDVHGEFKKLTHILSNASGSLRPLVDHQFEGRLDGPERLSLLALVYYPREAWAYHAARLAPAALDELARVSLGRFFELARCLAPHHDLAAIEALFPGPHGALFRELFTAPVLGRGEAYQRALLAPHLEDDHGARLLQQASRLLRQLSVSEVIVAGDLGDRGPRIDRVIEVLEAEPRVAFTWGNHDASWMGASLGQDACIATVLRLSLRYARLAQLEEGYGIPVEPLEQLARAAYGDDPAAAFRVKGTDLRDPLLLARMQKAAAVLQFKLEAQTSRRHPEFGLAHRDLLHRIDRAASTVEVDGKIYPLVDTHLPTVDPADPYALSAGEQACIDVLRSAFVASRALARQMAFVARRGAMLQVRDRHAIFHGCVPVDEGGAWLPLVVDGEPRAGRALFDALDTLVRRAFHERRPSDLDMLWYLWTGPASPLFGKDRMATFESYFIADKAAQHESKNPYFKLIHQVDFCRRVLAELGADPVHGLIVNGHVPVKLEAGESPIKQSGQAVTIDGAFSEAYGDKGYTLVLDASRTYLARHHHFDSVEAAITRGEDIIPVIEEVQRHDPPRRVADTEEGAALVEDIAALEALLAAYRAHEIEEA
jgi:fructose-1,6-bisphosphatase-3